MPVLARAQYPLLLLLRELPVHAPYRLTERYGFLDPIRP